MELWFYHLQRQSLAQVLPVLAGKALERGWRVVVQTVDDTRLAALDDHLWTYKDESFLPHGRAADPRAARQPIVLTTGSDNPNEAQLRIVVDGADFPPGTVEPPGYDRVILIFDGRDDVQLAGARAQWTRLKAAGLTLAYWQQDETGRWEQRMTSRPPASSAPAAG